MKNPVLFNRKPPNTKSGAYLQGVKGSKTLHPMKAGDGDVVVDASLVVAISADESDPRFSYLSVAHAPHTALRVFGTVFDVLEKLTEKKEK